MKNLVHMVVAVLTLWISLSAATQGHVAKEERTDDRPIGKEMKMEYEPEVELPEIFSKDFVGINKAYKGRHELERTGKLLKYRIKSLGSVYFSLQ